MRTFHSNLYPIILILMTTILAAFLLLGVSGCAEDSVMGPQDDPSKMYSVTADDLMANFVLAYGGRDLEAYAQLLHPDFIYTFDPEGCSELGPCYEFFTKEDELICAANMFSGEAVVNSRGQTLPAITDIIFNHWEQVGSWELEADGQMRGVFQIDILFTRQDASSLSVQSQQVFTVAQSEVYREVGGNLPYYQIIGWQDLR